MAIVTLVSPDGNPEVWDVNKIQEKLSEGYRTYEDWQAEQEELAQQRYQEWLTSPETEEERFSMLRQARDARISALDYMFLTDTASNSEMKEKYAEYRQALRDLPAQEGAPWDGGGELTPWPELPSK